MARMRGSKAQEGALRRSRAQPGDLGESRAGLRTPDARPHLSMLSATTLFVPEPRLINARPPAFAPRALFRVTMLRSWFPSLKAMVPMAYFTARSSRQVFPEKLLPTESLLS